MSQLTAPQSHLRAAMLPTLMGSYHFGTASQLQVQMDSLFAGRGVL